VTDLDFDLTVAAEPDRTRLTLRGELDLATAGALDRALAEHSGPVLLDLRQLTFMDSTGVRVLLEAAEQSVRDGRSLQMVPPQAGDARLTIEETGIASLLPLVEAPG
jgi:anti-sigma B factor antagonist